MSDYEIKLIGDKYVVGKDGETIASFRYKVDAEDFVRAHACKLCGGRATICSDCAANEVEKAYERGHTAAIADSKEYGQEIICKSLSARLGHRIWGLDAVTADEASKLADWEIILKELT